jgi:hypothetical protein
LRTAEKDAPSVHQQLAVIDHSLASIETEQVQALSAFTETAQHSAAKLEAIFARIGWPPRALTVGHRKDEPAATGGPFVPFKLDAHSPPFESALLRLQTSLNHLDHLTALVRETPLIIRLKRTPR